MIGMKAGVLFWLFGAAIMLLYHFLRARTGIGKNRASAYQEVEHQDDGDDKLTDFAHSDAYSTLTE